MKEIALGFGMSIDWTSPYWYDSLRSFLYGGHWNREPGYLSASGNVLGLTISIWYSK